MKLPAKSIAILVTSCFSIGHAQTTESTSSGSELTLFISAEDQQALELTQSAVTLPNTEEVTEEITSSKPDEESQATEYTDDSFRYDGVVMKGDQVLGLWFGGSRVPDVENYTSSDFSVVGSAGQLSLKKGDRSVVLVAGDYYSPQAVAVVNPAIAFQGDLAGHSSDASGSEIDPAESDQIDSEMGESSLSDIN